MKNPKVCLPSFCLIQRMSHRQVTLEYQTKNKFFRNSYLQMLVHSSSVSPMLKWYVIEKRNNNYQLLSEMREISYTIIKTLLHGAMFLATSLVILLRHKLQKLWH